jgi:hypothetical protein
LLIDNNLGILIKEVMDQFNASGSTSGGPCAAPVDVQESNDDQLRNARLKKKKVHTRSSLRLRTWLDHKQKRKEQSTDKKKGILSIHMLSFLSHLQLHSWTRMMTCRHK